ncbi:uncharacterized protein [Nothobranchius furzeri]|uniref:uncharacterized protein n=1 Tax=Nothobranchius furzeri TaxID=105023 RepID=UPI0024044D17|nr:uncharacterized protein LOC107373074 [Nothobranchius furzeri]
MLLLQWLLLFLDCGTQASHFSGTTMTYYPKETQANGSVSVILRYKSNYVFYLVAGPWTCTGNCGTETQITSSAKVDESSGEWCQSESITTRQLLNNFTFQLVFAGGDWISDIKNSITSWRAVTSVDLRKRSDTGKPNTSPQTTILPVLR